MIKSIEVSGKSREEAVSRALKQLGKELDEVSVEIVQRGKSGFLGIGAQDEIVRVSYEAEDEEPEVVPVEKAGKPAVSAASKPQEKKETKPAKSAKTRRYAEGEQAEATEKFLRGLLEHMGVEADMEIKPRAGGGLDVELSGSGIGTVIGRRGETLDAIQHLTNYAVNRGNDKRSHINVDAEGYRSRREESLVHLAEKMAAKTIKYKRSMALEPMNSYERHIIHQALQEYEGVSTSSTGSEPNRRVVINYVRPTKAEPEKPASDVKEWC